MGSVSDTILFERKFRKVHYEIDYLKGKIYRKSGFLFFQSHIYSIDALLQSEHHAKIYAITEKIGDDAENWYRSGELSETGREAYYRERGEVDDKLHQVNLEIQNREPTWWESVREPFTKFIRIVMNNMPDLVRTMLDRVANSLKLPSPIRKILKLPNATSKETF